MVNVHDVKEKLSIDECVDFIIEMIQSGVINISTNRNCGFDLWLPYLVKWYCNNNGITLSQSPATQYRELKFLYPQFLDALWLLTNKGILRPNETSIVSSYQSVNSNTLNHGYSLTSMGKKWFENKDDILFITTSKFSKIFGEFKELFGNAFYQRSLEAINTYEQNFYTASCVMTGSASEAILLAIASKKTKTEKLNRAIEIYSNTGKLKEIRDCTLGRTDKNIQDMYEALSFYIKKFRDNAAHGEETIISESEAYLSILNLYKLSSLIKDNWDNIIR
ncbi:MAG: hypothetical protein N4A44_04625 [Alphaproteobacteria bacterium]|jgi:hypothetical protein|nr:hypothetical protein [Alphaproteobacteria bacterium]